MGRSVGTEGMTRRLLGVGAEVGFSKLAAFL